MEQRMTRSICLDRLHFRSDLDVKLVVSTGETGREMLCAVLINARILFAMRP